SHTAVIWILAPFALKFGQSFEAEATDPYFQIVTGAIITGIAVWMIVRTHRERRTAADHHYASTGDGPHGGLMIEFTLYEVAIRQPIAVVSPTMSRPPEKSRLRCS